MLQKQEKNVVGDSLKRLRHMKTGSVYINRFGVKRIVVKKDYDGAYIVNGDDLMKAINKIQSSLINLYSVGKYLEECACLSTKKVKYNNKLVLTLGKSDFNIEVVYYSNSKLLHLIDENGWR